MQKSMVSARGTRGCASKMSFLSISRPIARASIHSRGGLRANDNKMGSFSRQLGAGGGIIMPHAERTSLGYIHR